MYMHVYVDLLSLSLSLFFSLHRPLLGFSHIVYPYSFTCYGEKASPKWYALWHMDSPDFFRCSICSTTLPCCSRGRASGCSRFYCLESGETNHVPPLHRADSTMSTRSRCKLKLR